MADSISQQVRKILKKNPGVTNQEIYKQFPEVRPNTLKHYRAKYEEEKQAKKTATRKTATAKTVKSAAKKNATKKSTVKSAPKPTKKELLKEKVFVFLDKNPDITNESFYAAFPEESKYSLRGFRTSHKKSVAGTNKRKKGATPKPAGSKKAANSQESLEDRMRALEDQLQQLSEGKKGGVKSSITAKAKDLEGNLLAFIKEKRKNLDEIQSYVSNEISTFISSVKNRKD